MEETLSSKTYKSIKWSYFSVILTAIFQIIYTSVQARLLSPKDFGIVAISNTIVGFGAIFAQMGLAQAIVQVKNVTDDEIKAAQTFSVLLSVIIALLFILLTPLFKLFFAIPELNYVLPILTLNFIVSGFYLIPQSLYQKNINFKVLALLEVFSFFIGYLIIGIFTAALGFAYWSLIIASISKNIIMLAFFLYKGHINFLFKFSKIRRFLDFSIKTFILRFIESINGNLTNFYAAKVFGSIALGYYNRASLLINLPMQYFTSTFQKIIFPVFATFNDSNERFKYNFLSILEALVFFSFIFAFLVFVFSKPIILLLLGNKWIGIEFLFKILTIAAFFDLSGSIIAVIIESKGLLTNKIVFTIFNSLLFVMFIFALAKYNLIGIGLAWLAISFIKFFSYYFIISYNIKIKFLEITKYFRSFFILFLISISNYLILKFYFNESLLFYILFFFIEFTFIYVLFYSSLNKNLYSYLKLKLPSNKITLLLFYK